ncbi:hypothetical protein OROHE_001837 [Orobanche hederae]
MATSRLFSLLGPSIVRRFSHVPSLEVNKICLLPSLRFKRYSSSALRLDSVSSSLTIGNTSAVYAHPWPEWVNFIDGLKAKGYLTSNAANDGDNEGLAVYTDMKLVKVACLSFARDRFDIFKSLSAQDVQTIVEKGCPDLNRKYVNSAKRLRAHLELDEGDVCGSCNLRGSCDRAYVMVNDDSEAAARTVDVVRILLFYALDPLVFSEENKPPGRELIESSARKLLQQLIELGETHPNPDLPKPASITSQRKKQPLDLSVNESSKSDEMKEGYWMCTKCNSMNLARNKRCLKCKAVGPKIKSVSVAEVEMKKGDWNCPQVIFEESRAPGGRGLIESFVWKLLKQLFELGERQPNPDLPKPTTVNSQRKNQPLHLSVNESSKNA